MGNIQGAVVANSCVFQKPVGQDSDWGKAQAFYYPAGNSTNASPFYFNADDLWIKCLAFPETGDSTTIFGLNQQIAAHTAAIANLQTQLTAVTPWAAASDAGGYATTELQVEYFGYVLGFLVVVYLADRIRRFFWREGGDHV